MTNIIDTQINTAQQQSASRVSYTINNQQPVISTFIGSQPLFYEDYSEDTLSEDEEFMFDSAELGILENELDALSKEIKTLDTLSNEFVRSPEDNINIFIKARETILNTSKPSITLDALRAELSKSRLAEAYLEQAEKFGVTLVHTSQVQAAQYDRKTGTIQINQNLSVAEQILLTGRELRRHFQQRQGALINPMHFHPDSAILINRAQQADMIASAIRIAWELQLSGSKETWEYIENSSFSDLGRAFVREAYADFRTINNGEATTAVFEAWFLSERCRAEDKILIRQMLSDQGGYVFDAENMHAAITPAFIAALGEMPFGKNYLAMHADTVLTDPIFTEVRDRSNANFLWFIKFERTFRETERDLQSEFSSNSGNSAGDLQTQDTSDENKVVTLYDSQPVREIDGTEKKYAQAGSNNVVYLRSNPSE